VNRLVQRAAIAVGVLLSSIVTTACSSSSGGAPIDAGVEASRSTDADCDPALTYASFGMDFFATFCGRCHAWTQESAQLDGDLLAGAAGTSTAMPPSAPFPTPGQRMQLVQWIACGAP
jgi:cytochrome c5